MAMTKKERAEMDAAIERAELLAALRWTAPVQPDVAPPQSGGGYTEGWVFNAYSSTVQLEWSGSVLHGSGPAPRDGKRASCASQRSQWMYSTKAKALAAMRHEVERESARKLLAIDKRLRDEEQR